MFKIETTEDVKILKELTKSSNDYKIQELELEIQRLSKINNDLLTISEQQKQIIDKLNKNAVTAEQCRSIVFDLIKNQPKKETLIKNKKISVVKSDTDDFVFTKIMKRKFNQLLVNGNTLIHYTKKNQKMPFALTVLELLAFTETYLHRDRKLYNKDSEKLCKLFDINKVQFGRIYYNLKEGVFFKTLEEIDNQIKRTSFKIVDKNIYIINSGKEIDTKIDVELFNYLVNIYVNSNQPYLTIYKLSKEHKDINPIFLLTVLKRNGFITKLIKG